jgi:hypothetical protein
MPLSEYERKVIEDLERLLTVDEGPQINHDAERLCVAALVSMLLGTILLLLMFQSSALFGLVGFAMLFAGSVGIHLGIRQGGLERLYQHKKPVPRRRSTDF